MDNNVYACETWTDNEMPLETMDNFNSSEHEDKSQNRRKSL